jgi:tetratricopeptide (TPR) repeat protein
VPPTLEWNGYSETVVTRLLTDELREMNREAAEELTGITIDDSGVEKSLSQFEEYFDLTQLVNGTRHLLGLVPYFVQGEFRDRGGEIVLNIRVYAKDESKGVTGAPDVTLVPIQGTAESIETMLHEGTIEILNQIDPYIVALFYHRTELKERDFDFPKTREVIKEYMRIPPVADNSLAYDLLGRMYIERAEMLPELTEAERRAERMLAIDYLRAALIQEPEFLLPHLNLGILYAATGEYALSDHHFAEAVRLDPDHLPTRERWAEALLEQGRVRGAIFQYVAAVELNGDRADLRDTLANLYVRAHRPDAARTQWEEALIIEPDNRTYRASLAALQAGTQ